MLSLSVLIALDLYFKNKALDDAYASEEVGSSLFLKPSTSSVICSFRAVSSTWTFFLTFLDSDSELESSYWLELSWPLPNLEPIWSLNYSLASWSLRPFSSFESARFLISWRYDLATILLMKSFFFSFLDIGLANKIRLFSLVCLNMGFPDFIRFYLALFQILSSLNSISFF